MMLVALRLYRASYVATTLKWICKKKKITYVVISTKGRNLDF